MTINFEKEYDKNLDIDYETIADKVINAALDYEKCPYEAEVSLTLTDNKGIHDITESSGILTDRRMYFHFLWWNMRHRENLIFLKMSMTALTRRRGN